MGKRDETNWLEEYLPIPWGGLQVFLWSLVFLLEGSVLLEIISMYPEFPFEEHLVINMITVPALCHFVYRCCQIFWFLVTSATIDKPQNFPWMRKYLRNNASGAPLQFTARVNQEVYFYLDRSALKGGRVLREGGTHLHTERTTPIEFNIRCGGWFFRRQSRPNVYWSVKIDFGDAFKHRNARATYFLRYKNEEVVLFETLYEALDHLVIHGGTPPTVTSRAQRLEMQSKLTTIKQFMAEVTRLSDKHDHSSAWVDKEFQVVFQIYRQVIHHLKQNPRVAENLTANLLIRAILDQIIELCEETKVDSSCTYVQMPATTIDEMKRVCKEEVIKLTEVYNKKNPKSQPSPPAQTARTA